VKVNVERNGSQLVKKISDCELGDVVNYSAENCIIIEKRKNITQLVSADFSRKFVVANHIALPVAQKAQMTIQF